MDLVSSFLIGVVASLIATYLYMAMRDRKNNNKNAMLDIEGVWLESMPQDAERPFSIGIIKFDKKKKRYIFDGANYKKNGDPFCTWRATYMQVDISAMQVEYFFKASACGHMNQENTGFGVMRLKVGENGKYTLKDGYYQEAKINAEPLTHLMERLEVDAYISDDPSDYGKYIKSLLASDP